MQGSQAQKNFPVTSVGILIFSPHGRVLLVRSHKWNNLYTLPGGKVDYGERCIDAAKREAKEETNLDVVNLKFCLFQECIFSDQFWKKNHLIMHDYRAEIGPNQTEGDVFLNDEAETFVWIDPKEAFSLPLTRETENLLRSV